MSHAPRRLWGRAVLATAKRRRIQAAMPRGERGAQPRDHAPPTRSPAVPALTALAHRLLERVGVIAGAGHDCRDAVGRGGYASDSRRPGTRDRPVSSVYGVQPHLIWECRWAGGSTRRL